MKKFAFLGVLLFLASCSEISGLTGGTADSAQTQMKTCLLAEANARYAAGTLFTGTIRSTASDLVKTCMKKLALQSVGISQESQSTAESIISNLQALANAQ